ncbi:MAG TPA: tetratricopeptide repeat protein [Nitrospirota bacterium]|nr:tetratricopeptide repeat protein [Nitrospirota bacterium]
MKIVIVSLILLLSASSCGPIPRIIVLHDALTMDEHISLGLSYEQKGENDLAVQEYIKAMKMSDDDFRPFFYAGNVYYKKKEYKLAEKYYNKALKIAPDNGDVHNNLAWVYIDTGKFEDAGMEAEKAVRIKRSPYYLNTLAHIYYRVGRYEDAQNVLEEAMTLTSPEDKILRDDEIKLLEEIKGQSGSPL